MFTRGDRRRKRLYRPGAESKKRHQALKQAEQTPCLGARRTRAGLCRIAGLSRQASYQVQKARPAKACDEAKVVEEVQAIRSKHPTLGGRKVGALLPKTFHLGRDRLFQLLRRHGLLVPRPTRKTPKTTDSKHALHKYPNLLLQHQEPLDRPNQVWVSDITYVSIGPGFGYLALTMDLYSRKILGFQLHHDLSAQGPILALKQALAQQTPSQETIHHSDQGAQFACHQTIALLKAAKVHISMTQFDHCYENASAERLNGILKQEYGLGYHFRTWGDALHAVEEAVYLYNHERPYLALKMRIPALVHAASPSGAGT